MNEMLNFFDETPDNYVMRMYYTMRLSFLRPRAEVEEEKASVERKLRILYDAYTNHPGIISKDEALECTKRVITKKDNLCRELNEILLYEEKLKIYSPPSSNLPDVVVPPRVDNTQENRGGAGVDQARIRDCVDGSWVIHGVPSC